MEHCHQAQAGQLMALVLIIKFSEDLGLFGKKVIIDNLNNSRSFVSQASRQGFVLDSTEDEHGQAYWLNCCARTLRLCGIIVPVRRP